MTKMSRKEFSKRILNASNNYWGMVLNGDRNLGYEKATLVSKILGTSVDLWINPNASVNDRRIAWTNFNEVEA